LATGVAGAAGDVGAAKRPAFVMPATVGVALELQQMTGLAQDDKNVLSVVDKEIESIGLVAVGE
jgi:hypothetical protein